MQTFEVVCPSAPDTTTLRDHAVGLAVALAVVALADFALRQLSAALAENDAARWFTLHSSFNVAVTMTSLQDVVSVFTNPLCSLVSPMRSWLPAYLVISGHCYHACAFSLKSNEVWHHLIFVAFGGFITLSVPWGPLMALALFCVSGLPGAIDYAVLALVKLKRVSRLREKRCNTWINTWIRIPGHVFVAVVAWVCLVHGTNTRLPTSVVVVAIALALGNGLYYGEQVIGNYHYARAKAEVA